MLQNIVTVMFYVSGNEMNKINNIKWKYAFSKTSCRDTGKSLLLPTTYGGGLADWA